MKHLAFVLLISICFSCQIRADNVQTTALKAGFRDVTLGEDLSAINGLVKTGKSEDYSIYRRTTDILTLGKTPLDSITYSFWNGKLAMIRLQRKTSVLTNEMNQLAEFTTSVYGKPTKINRDGNPSAMVHIFKTIWEDSNTTILYTVIMTDPSPPSDSFGHVDLSIVIKSKEIDDQIMKAKGVLNSKSPTGI